MSTILYHIRSVSTISVMLLALTMVIGTTYVYADDAKRPASSKAESARDRSAKKVAIYTTSISGAVSTTMRALGAQRLQNTPKPAHKVNVGIDTSRKDNQVVFARVTSDVFTARIELTNDEQYIEVGIYNMLGKKVVEVYKGSASRGQHDYTQPILELPEGVYICILQGNAFRKAEKFFLSR